MIYDITIVGNGIIGTTITAELLKKISPKKNTVSRSYPKK